MTEKSDVIGDEAIIWLQYTKKDCQFSLNVHLQGCI